MCVCGLLTPRLMHPVVSYDGGGNKAPTGEFISSPERALNKQRVNQCLHLFFSDKSACVVRWCDSDLQAGVALSSHISSQRE